MLLVVKFTDLAFIFRTINILDYENWKYLKQLLIMSDKYVTLNYRSNF